MNQSDVSIPKRGSSHYVLNITMTTLTVQTYAAVNKYDYNYKLHTDVTDENANVSCACTIQMQLRSFKISKQK